MSLVLVAAAGVGIGIAFGLFGAGGSAFGTPVLALLGVPAPIAIASPLPAVLPAALVGAREYFGVEFLRIPLEQFLHVVPGGLPRDRESRPHGEERVILIEHLNTRSPAQIPPE